MAVNPYLYYTSLKSKCLLLVCQNQVKEKGVSYETPLNSGGPSRT